MAQCDGSDELENEVERLEERIRIRELTKRLTSSIVVPISTVKMIAAIIREECPTEALRELVESIDAETEASKKWYLNPASSKKWDRASKRREAAMRVARAALAKTEPADAE